MKDPRFAEHLAMFVEVARQGSFSAAARRRAVTPSAVVRQVDALEDSLGVRLLLRSTRALSLTEAGQRLLVRGQRLLDDLDDVRSEIGAFDGAVAGVLRVACFPTFGKRYVLPVLAELMQTHPGLAAEVDLTERLANPVTERLDAVIRIGELADSGLFASHLADQRRLVVASPDYVGRCGQPRAPQDLLQHRLLDKLHGADLLGWRDIVDAPAGDAATVVFRSDDFEALRLACLAGMGIALLADWVVGCDVLDGRLIRLDLGEEVWNTAPSGIHLLRALPRPSAKLQAFAESLQAFIGSPPRWSILGARRAQ